jgi:hypothetical protein
MPTPFTHLQTAQQLLKDEQIAPSIRVLLNTERSAFLLGNIAADARIDSGMMRADTHFYQYDKPMIDHPWRVMMARFPALKEAQSEAQQAFLAGYVAHLSMDEIWSLNMLGPNFVDREWGTRELRFLMLHVILIYMDERDYSALESWHKDSLYAAQPDSWLPFMSDQVLTGWRDMIGMQLPPDGKSLTLEIFGKRISKTPDEFRAILDSPEEMRDNLWDNIAPEILVQIEARMYEFAREQMLAYWDEFAALISNST